MSDRVLLFMNEVAGGRKLLRRVRERAERGDVEFFVVAPANQPKVGQLVDEAGSQDAAQSRVDVTLRVLSGFGIEARGFVGDPHPALALDDAVRSVRPTEIVISCRPETRFGPMRRDLVAWATGRYDVPVEHISVRIEDDAISWEVTHTLVVASRTVASRELIDRLKSKAAEAPHRFTIVCPRTGDSEDDRVALCERLATTLAELYREDIPATGQPASADPFAAVANAIRYYSVDEILVSTLKGESSRWLQEGLVDRVKEMTNKPVAHIEVSPDAAGTAQPVGAGER